MKTMLTKVFFPFLFFYEKFDLLTWREVNIYTPPVSMERINSCLESRDSLERWRAFYEDRAGSLSLFFVFVVVLGLSYVLSQYVNTPFESQARAIELGLLVYLVVNFVPHLVFRRRLGKAKEDFEGDYFGDWFIDDLLYDNKYLELTRLAEKHHDIKTYLDALNGRPVLAQEYKLLVDYGKIADEFNDSKALASFNERRRSKMLRYGF